MFLSNLLLFIFFLIFQVCLCGDETSLPPNSGQALDLAEYAWSSGILGVVLIAAGTFLTFAGKRWFKPFLAVSGFLASAVLVTNLLDFINKFIAIPYAFYVYWVVAVIVGLLGAFLCYKMWEIGVLAAAGFGGYTLGVWIMSMKSGLLIEGYMTRSIFLTIMTCVAVAIAWFFDEVAIVVASSVTGGMALVVGIDCFIKWGLATILIAMMRSSSFTAGNVDMYVYIELAGVAVLAVMGALVQFLTGTSKKGHRSDRV